MRRIHRPDQRPTASCPDADARDVSLVINLRCECNEWDHIANDYNAAKS
jgi:hypothetical protein